MGSLLQGAGKKIKLIIISEDGDFCDELDKSIKPFLLKEWVSKNKGKLELFKKLNDFLLIYAPEFKLSDQTKNDIHQLIEELENSGSFAQTHSLVENLQNYIDSFSKDNARQIISAFLNNNQVGWISGDDDVIDFCEKSTVNTVQMKNVGIP